MCSSWHANLRLSHTPRAAAARNTRNFILAFVCWATNRWKAIFRQSGAADLHRTCPARPLLLAFGEVTPATTPTLIAWINVKFFGPSPKLWRNIAWGGSKGLFGPVSKNSKYSYPKNKKYLPEKKQNIRDAKKPKNYPTKKQQKSHPEKNSKKSMWKKSKNSSPEKHKKSSP